MEKKKEKIYIYIYQKKFFSFIFIIISFLLNLPKSRQTTAMAVEYFIFTLERTRKFVDKGFSQTCTYLCGGLIIRVT